VNSLQFRPEAAADLEEAVVWYESQRQGLGVEFLERTKDVLARIQRNPNQFPVVLRETRRAMLKRFPYSVFFRILSGNVLIVAVMHFRQSPRRWKRRT
jgi:toxin ParE1/3/4